MKKKWFDILRYIAENKGNITQKMISEETGYSLSSVNSAISDLEIAGLIDNRYKVSEKGTETLEPYKVKNAIILAAGMSTRFVPVSYEIPKGLISVKGEVMTERLIRQLQEAGVQEIVLVVGYMMEKFFYLRDKYGVKLVVNNEFATKNTHSSIYAARNFLSNTYIVCSDNYYPKNMFHKYEYRAFYCSVYLPGKSYVERAFTFDNNNLIIATNKPSEDQWIMYGHAYFSQDFTNDFTPILESYYGKPGIEYMYWETIYAENVEKLKMWVMKCTDKDIFEFDSMEELKQFDPDYISNNKIKMFDNIQRILHCELSDISDIQAIKEGLNNHSFKVSCNGKSYVYRHPGVNASAVVDRHKEASALKIAQKLGIDNTLIYIDEEVGWKISEYIEETETFDFGNIRHIELLANQLKKLHSSKIKTGFTFDYRKEAKKLIINEKSMDSSAINDFLQLQEHMKPIFDWLDTHEWQKSLCHNDLYSSNLLISGNNLSVIDWEFAGDNDIGYDICKLFSVNNPSYDEIDKYLFSYYGRSTTEEEKLHLLACASVIYYYWYVWGIFAVKNNSDVSGYLPTWFEKMNHYSNEVIKRIG